MRSFLVTACLALSLAACGAAPSEVRPVAGTTLRYVQTFRLQHRRSGGEELPDLRIVRPLSVTCTESTAESATFEILHGDVSVWVDSEAGEPDFVAATAGDAERAFDAEEANLATMYAALWATTAHLAGRGVIDVHGNLEAWGGPLEDVRTERDEDPSTDLAGSFLESLLDDPGLLFAARDGEGRRPLQFRLGHWNASFRVKADAEETDDGGFTLAYASDSGAERDGPFTNLTLGITGNEARDPVTGELLRATLELTVSADVPLGAPGAMRSDSGELVYELARAAD